MYESLRRYLAKKIDVYYDDDWNPVEISGCDHTDFKYIKLFCDEVAEDPDLFDAIIADLADISVIISCDCQYLTEFDGDYIITRDGEPPLNPN
jgi:hypothetical protein